MIKTAYFARIVFVGLLLLSLPNRLLAQPLDYDKAMDDIMAGYLPDYPEPTIKALDQLLAGANVEELPAQTRFFYYYYYAGCLTDNHPDDAIEYFTQARKVAYSSQDVGIRNAYALDAERALADLYLAKRTEEYVAGAMLLYNDVITVGISLLSNPDIGSLVVQSLIEEAKMGIKIWLDEEWVKKMWIQARDLALEINDGATYSYYLLNVMKYYCDLGDYDTALSFVEDAKNKDILQVNASSFCQHISDVKRLVGKRESIKASKGIHSLDFWSNQLDIATLSTAICSEDKAFQLLQEVEQGLMEHNLTGSFEYAQVLYLLSNNTFKHPEIAEDYFARQIKILETAPQYFAYISDTDAFNSLAVCQMKQGKNLEAQGNYLKALACLERDKAYSDQPGYKRVLATVYHNVGRNLYFLGNYQESVDYFNKSIALQEDASGNVMPKTKVYLSESLSYISKH